VQSQVGLRLLPPDLISKARDDTAAQVSRILYTFVGTAAFCLLSLWNPDSALLGGNEKINVPLAGPVSFFGFILLGPVVLIVLRIYLQIYVEHSDRLDCIARRMAIVRTPTLAPLKNPLIRGFSGIAFYLLLPGTMLFFTWKAAVFPRWGSGLLGVAVVVIAIHVILLIRKVSWRLSVLLSASVAILVAILVGVAAFGLGVRRPFYLDHANLSGQLLVRQDLMGADLRDARLVGTELSVANLNDARLNQADLTHAHLARANLSGASLVHATLSATDLSHADLSGANLTSANLYNADLTGANLSGANLEDAHLGEARLDGQAQLDVACGRPRVLPQGLTVSRKCM
jgi:hypothetical protein